MSFALLGTQREVKVKTRGDCNLFEADFPGSENGMCAYTEGRIYTGFSCTRCGDIDSNRDYSIVFFENGVERTRILRVCRGEEIPQRLRGYRKKYPTETIAAVPESTLDEDFIERFGIGIH